MVTIDGYPIDAAVTLEHGSEAEATDYPIESGSDATDNVRIKPATLTIEGVVSDTPLVRVSVFRLGDEQPSRTADALLREIQTSKRFVRVVTPLRVYAQVALLTFTVTQNGKTGRALRFRATFKEVQFVSNERSTVRVAVPRAAKKKNRGHKPAAKVDTNVLAGQQIKAGKRASLLTEAFSLF